MCGRFVGFRNVEALKRHFPIDLALGEMTANYNVAPAQPIPTIVRREGVNVLQQMHWGLVPHWAKDLSIGAKMINARVETVASKPSFREAFKKRRCLIPADGFYEWKGPKGDKQPVYITLPEGEPFAFAGLWESWTDRGRLETPHLSCTIITRPAQGPLQAIHHRMPAILHPDDYAAWLDTANVDTADLSETLAQRTIVELVFQPVSRRVNATRNNGPDNIKPVQRELDF